jgi:hypothetical protein
MMDTRKGCPYKIPVAKRRRQLSFRDPLTSISGMSGVIHLLTATLPS